MDKFTMGWMEEIHTELRKIIQDFTNRYPSDIDEPHFRDINSIEEEFSSLVERMKHLMKESKGV